MTTPVPPHVPLISIGIPSYNAEAYIAQAIESVLGQTFADWELIVSDDASTDRTVAIAESFADPRIRVVRNAANLGVAANWTQCVRLGRGKYRKLLCHDDVIYPTLLEKQAAFVQRQPNVAVLGSHRDIIGPRGERIFRDRRSGALRGIVPAPQAIKRIVRSGTNLFGEPAAVLFRAADFERAGAFAGRSIWMIDIDMWCRLLRFGDAAVLPETLSAFRVSESALSTQLRGSQAREAIDFFQRLGREYPGHVSRADLLYGSARALVMQSLRKVVYRLRLKGQ